MALSSVFCATTIHRMEKTKKRGRPPKPEGEKLERRAMYLPPELWEKIDAHGLEWLRALIRRARPPAS